MLNRIQRRGAQMRELDFTDKETDKSTRLIRRRRIMNTNVKAISAPSHLG